MKKFEVVLKNEKEETYSIISLLLLSSNFITIILITTAIHFTKWGPYILSIIAIACIFGTLYFKEPNEKPTYYWAFFFFSLAWFDISYNWLGYLNLLFSALDQISRRRLPVQFYNDKVIYPTVIPKKISWAKISNVILKDGILTIDLKNNKLMQQSIDNISASINEKEFNDFCKQQLNA